MNDFSVLSKKIRDNPLLFLRKKSLTALLHFLRGFGFRLDVEEWIDATGLNFVEHVDKAVGEIYSKQSKPATIDEAVEFFEYNEFVYDYYNPSVKGLGYGAATDAVTIILENSSSEEEAFDKYFELEEAFDKHKNDPNYVKPASKIIFQSDVDAVINGLREQMAE